jgi:MoxR-like ATPase
VLRYEGLDISTAVYEWNYTRQILEIRLLEGEGASRDEARKTIFSEEFLLKRPLLRAIENHAEAAPVLLIDELDRADEEFESFLLELLSDWQITIPELGTLRVSIPAREDAAESKSMELPQMGTSDYVRRTMTLRSVNGEPSFQYEGNPDKNARKNQ